MTLHQYRAILGGVSNGEKSYKSRQSISWNRIFIEMYAWILWFIEWKSLLSAFYTACPADPGGFVLQDGSAHEAGPVSGKHWLIGQCFDTRWSYPI